MGSRLITRRESGKVIIDSDQICMGLVKSGYMQYLGTWQRWRRRSLNGEVMEPYDMYDAVYGFTVKAVAPLVFIAGSAVLANSERNGDFVTFYYGRASENTRFFVFDLMADRGGGAKLKLRREDGTVTLDTFQRPLNIIGTATPPAPSSYSAQYLGFGTAYAGGSTSYSGSGNYVTAWCTWSTAPNLGSDLAVALPWSRAASHTYDFNNNASIGANEWAYGNGVNVTFVFATEPGAQMNSFFNGSFGGNQPPVFFGIPITRFPQASIIDASVLPFPFDIT